MSSTFHYRITERALIAQLFIERWLNVPLQKDSFLGVGGMALGSCYGMHLMTLMCATESGASCAMDRGQLALS
jgi:hypothetical protein